MPDTGDVPPNQTTSKTASRNAVPAKASEAGQRSSHSVSICIGQVKAGAPEGMDPISKRYFEPLARVADALLRRKGQPAACDGGELVNDALMSFYKRAANGKFPEIEDREALWKILSCMVKRKACRRIQHEMCQTRGGGHVQHESDLLQTPSGAGSQGLDELAIDDREPSPEAVVIAAEVVEQTSEALPPGPFREVLRLMLEGFTQREIAKLLGLSQSTVSRCVKLNRMTLQERFEEEIDLERESSPPPSGHE